MPNPVQLADDSGQPINILNPLPTLVTPGTGPTSLGKAADAPHALADGLDRYTNRSTTSRADGS